MALEQKYCPSCGTQNSIEVAFCIACGKKFPQITAEQTQAFPQPQMPAEAPPLPQAGRSDFITLSCPKCGGRLQITPDIERFACQYCGYEHIVRRSGGMVSLEPVVHMMGQINNSIGMVGAGVNRLGFSSEKQASESAIVRLKTEIAEMQKEIESYNKSSTGLWISAVIFAWPALTAMLFRYLAGMGRIWGILGWAFTFIFLLMLLAAIANATGNNKEINKRAAEIRKKSEEIERHRQIVSM